MLALRILAFLVGSVMAVGVLGSAIRTVVVPRGESTFLTRLVFEVTGWFFSFLARPSRPFLVRDRWLARYAPVSLVVLPIVWAGAMIIAFIPMFWAFGSSWKGAMVVSGSSFTTLGIAQGRHTRSDILSSVEALLGLVLIALTIAFLPTIYARFAEREQPMTRLALLAGTPLDPVQLLVRLDDAEMQGEIGERWLEWEQWFASLRESHTSFPPLIFFRSQDPRVHWLTAAATALDTAALAMAALERSARTGGILLRTGFESLRAIADNLGLPYDPDPAADDPISVDRAEFLLLVGELRAAGLECRTDDEAIWRDWAGWRVNYDEVLVQMAAILVAPPARLLRPRERPPRLGLTRRRAVVTHRSRA